MTLENEITEERKNQLAITMYLINQIPYTSSADELRYYKDQIEERDDIPTEDKEILYSVINLHIKKREYHHVK